MDASRAHSFTAQPIAPASSDVVVELAGHRRARGDDGPGPDAQRSSVLDSLDAHIAVLDAHGTIVMANASWEAYVAANGGGRVVGANYLEVCDAAPDDPHAQVAARGIRAILADESERFEHEYPCHAPDAERWFTLRAVREAAPGPIRVVVLHVDITARRHAEAQAGIRASLLDVVDVAIIATDASGVVTHWNSGAERATGWAAAEAIGTPVHDLGLSPADREQALLVRSQVQATGRWEGRFEITRRNGTTFPALVRNVALTDGEGNPAGVVGCNVDLSASVAAERELRSARDFSRAVNDSIGEGVCAIDLDGRVLYLNPTAEGMLGWTQADILGESIHELVHRPESDGAATPADDCPILRVGRTGVAARSDDLSFMRRDGTHFPVSFTATPFDAPGGVLGTVLVFSDDSEHRAALERMQRELDTLATVALIREALDEDRFVLHAQPIVDLATDEVIQHELLIRMRDRDGDFIAPAAFLPIAEQHGLICEIDRWVLREAAGLAAQGNPVELNVSAESLRQPGLLDEVRAALSRTGADPALMVFELTETALLHSEEVAAQFVAGVVELGCGFALDDFGTGYGGFTYLKRLPVGYLKIDVEFVRDLSRDEASQHVVRAVVSLARGLGLKTVAEGVEDAETLVLLREYGVDFAQGFLLGRPAPLGERMLIHS